MRNFDPRIGACTMVLATKWLRDRSRPRRVRLAKGGASNPPNPTHSSRRGNLALVTRQQNKNDHQPSNHKRAGEQVMRAWPCSSSLHRPRLRESCEPARRARDTRRGASWRGTSAAQTFPQRATRFATPDGVSPEGQRAATPTGTARNVSCDAGLGAPHSVLVTESSVRGLPICGAAVSVRAVRARRLAARSMTPSGARLRTVRCACRRRARAR